MARGPRDELAPPRPSPEALRAAAGGSVPDLIAPGLRVLFCGINPSLYSAAVGHHFARPGNRFWRTIFRAGFSDRLLAPHEGRLLLASGIGITNVVRRATASADELAREDYVTGARALRRKLLRYQPRVVAFLGLGAYRVTTGHPGAKMGHQAERFAGVDVWALPNPSGLNAHYSMDALIECYASLRRALSER